MGGNYITSGFINCNVIPFTGRKKLFHGFGVKDSKICYIGDYDSIMDKSDEILNIQGSTVLPGFIDAHTHMVKMGLDMTHLDLSDALSFEEVKFYLQKELESRAESKEDDWIIGIDFDETKWKTDELPTKKDLNSISSDIPIVIKRVCTHVAVANEAALAEMEDDDNINRETGVLKEDPVWRLDQVIGISIKDRKEAIRRAIEKAQSFGITGIHDIVDSEDWNAYKELDKEVPLGLRVRCYIRHSDMEDITPTVQSPYLSLLGVKIFVDGSLGARTAALEEDYADDPGNRGMLLLSQEEIEDIIEVAEMKDLQVMAHAIGDRGISTLLDAFENASSRTKELRHRIEHAEVLSTENIRRIRDLGLILSVQPNFAYNWSQPGGMNENRLGAERFKNCNPYWDAQRALVKMAFGSDTMPMGPLFGVFSAINHPILEQRISTFNALQCYTVNGAFIGKDEEHFGRIEDDMDADFVVLSDNPLDSEDIEDIEIIMTVVNGEIVFDGRHAD